MKFGWKATLDVADVFRSHELPFESARDQIVSRINTLRQRPEFLNDFEVEDIAVRLACAPDESEFDVVWDEFYDWADAHSVWVATF